MSPLRDKRGLEALEDGAPLTRRDWAWEFLRRNPAFVRDWQEVERGFRLGAGDLGGLRPDAHSLAILAKWGMIFRG
ncbi:MAG: DUF6499 domain-containing protein [Parvibaculaceae bacterium]